MKFLSWNTWVGRATQAALTLAEVVQADVVMLQEAQPAGLWSDGIVGSTVSGRDWGSWILVRTGVLQPIELLDYAGWVAGARWVDNEGEIYLFSVHSPTSSEGEPRGTYVSEVRKIIAAICTQVPLGAPLVIGGDFNFTSLGERLVTEPLRTTSAESDALREFQTRGLSVAWRECNQDSPLPQTLRWIKDPSIPYHCDGFLTRDLKGRSVSCDVIANLREVNISSSDHNPVILEIAPLLPGRPKVTAPSRDR